jgi:hypothetical protein
MGVKDPKHQTTDEWIGDYKAEEKRAGNANDIETWVELIMRMESRSDRVRALPECPEDIRPFVKREVTQRWKNKGKPDEKQG